MNITDIPVFKIESKKLQSLALKAIEIPSENPGEKIPVIEISSFLMMLDNPDKGQSFRLFLAAEDIDEMITGLQFIKENLK